MKVTTKATIAGLVVAFGFAPAAAEQGRNARPANDDISSAAIVLDTPFIDRPNLKRAGLETGEPQSTCGNVKSSVWYQFAPSEDTQAVAEVSSSFKSILAIYSADGLVQTKCSGASTSPDIEFEALKGQSYFIQVGSIKKKAGRANMKLSTTSWRESVITHFSQPIEISDTGTNQIHIEGHPRADDRSMYDISVTAAGEHKVKRGVLTFGLVQQDIDIELVRIPHQHVQLDVTIAYRYDSEQYTCLSDGGAGQPCMAKAPFKDLNWLTGGEGSRAELVVKVKVSKDKKSLAERTITLPYAGQVVGLP